MLTSLEIYGARPGAPPLSFAFNAAGSNNPIVIKDIQGLGPVKATFTTSPYGIQDGEVINGVSVGKRNIVITFGLNPDWHTQSMTELRHQLYKYFMPKLPVRLRFFSPEIPTCEITGTVEDMSPNIFAKDPEIQVSIICPRPDFISIAQTTLEGVVGAAPVPINYQGSVPTGLKVKVVPSGSRGAYTGYIRTVITNLGTQKFEVADITVDTPNNFIINAVPGFKYVRSTLAYGLETDGWTNRLSKVVSGSIWPVILPGSNDFSVEAALPGQIWYLYYYARFGGL